MTAGGFGGGLKKYRKWEDTNFWGEHWVEETPLKILFPRFYRLSMKKYGSIRDMGEWEDDEWRWRWQWRREPFGREIDSYNNLTSLIHKFNPKEDATYGWGWSGNSNGIYKTKHAYEFMMSLGTKVMETRLVGSEFKWLWKKFAPFKASTITWRLMWNRLPTRDNLLKKKVLTSHLFITCIMVHTVWSEIYKWCKVAVVMRSGVREHFLHNSGILYDWKKLCQQCVDLCGLGIMEIEK